MSRYASGTTLTSTRTLNAKHTPEGVSRVSETEGKGYGHIGRMLYAEHAPEGVAGEKAESQARGRR
jgi:hypothetical protein